MRATAVRAGTAVGAGLVAVAVAAPLLRLGGAVDSRSLPGLPGPGFFSLWGLPATRLGAQLFAVGTVGLLLAAAALSPRDNGGLSVVAYRRLRSALWIGLAWVSCVLGQGPSPWPICSAARCKSSPGPAW